MSDLIILFFCGGKETKITIKEDSTFDELKSKYLNTIGFTEEKVNKFLLEDEEIKDYSGKTLAELGIKNHVRIDVICHINNECDNLNYFENNIVNITFKGNDMEMIIQSNKEEKMKDIFDNFFEKIYLEKNKTKFYYKEQIINPELSLNEIITKDDNDKNIMEIIFIEDECDEINKIINEDENSENDIAVVNFKGTGINIDIFCKTNEKMKNIFDIFCEQTKIDKSDIEFIWEKTEVDADSLLTFSDLVNKKDKNINKIEIYINEKPKFEECEEDDDGFEEECGGFEDEDGGGGGGMCVRYVISSSASSLSKIVEIILKFEIITIKIFCYNDDKMKFIFDKFFKKIRIDKNIIEFYYNDKIINEESKLNEVVSEDDIIKKVINIKCFKKKVYNVIFDSIDNGQRLIIQSNADNKMDNIINELCLKKNLDKASMLLFYNGEKINPELKLYDYIKGNNINTIRISYKKEIPICGAGNSINELLKNNKNSMSKIVEVNFNLDLEMTVIYGYDDDKMGDFFNKFFNLKGENKDGYIFIYYGNIINPESRYNNIVNEYDRKRNKITILCRKEEENSKEEVKHLSENKKLSNINNINQEENETNFPEEQNINQNSNQILIEKNKNIMEEQAKEINKIFNEENKNIIQEEIKEKNNIKNFKEDNKNVIQGENTFNNNIQILKEKKIKKYNLNIIYYDENLKNKENSENSSFFDMNINGTFYGCHHFELFKTVCKKIKNNQKEFILITSGSSAQKIIDYCSKYKFIREYYIYCFNINKYQSLMNQYPKIKGIYNNFDELKEKLYTITPVDMKNILSSNLIYFEDYSRIYIKLHHEFIRKYFIYKILKSEKCNEFQLITLIEREHPHLLEWVKELFPDKNEIINFFKEYVEEKDKSDDKLNNILNCDDNILNDNIKSYIKNYTLEGFYYKYLNKFLREGNFNAFRILSSHIAKFIFKLYDYREKNISLQKKSDLYRKMYINPKEVKLYKDSIGRVICYPAFTSTSISLNAFTPMKYDDKLELVLLVIKQNNTKSVISIKEFSEYQNEEEYLFLPFSFFKIEKVVLKTGDKINPHIINLTALNTEKPVEEMFSDFMDKITDNLNPEGLDFLLLQKNNTKLILNPIYLKEPNNSNGYCLII